jgi:site-specific DNA recombinase
MTTSCLRAVGYRRVSMREQVDGFSLEAQAMNIRKYATERDWELVQIYTDAGISAKKDSQRPQFLRLMEDAQAGQFDVVIVDKIDRFYRHLSGLLNTLDQLNNCKVTFASVQERLDFSTPWGKLSLTMLGMLAEIYIDNLRQETRKGKLQRAREGLWNGNIPYGYCKGLCSRCNDPNGPGYCPDVGQKDKSDGSQLVMHPIDSQVVRMAFELYRETPNDVHIAEILNSGSFTHPDGTVLNYRQKGTPGQCQPRAFSKDFMRGLIKQIFYTGKIPYYGKDNERRVLEAVFNGQHPAIISEEEFQLTQEIRKSTGSAAPHQGHPHRVYPLTGILFCGTCGWPLRGTAVYSNPIRFYVDAGHVDRHNVCDGQFRVKALPLEQQVADLLGDAIQAWEKMVNPQSLSRNIEEAEAQLQRAQELYIHGEITKNMLDREKARFEKLVKPLQKQELTATLAAIKKLQPAIADWSSVSTIEQKRLLRLVVEAIFVRENAIVAVQPTFAFNPVLLLLQSGSNKSGPDGKLTRGA